MTYLGGSATNSSQSRSCAIASLAAAFALVISFPALASEPGLEGRDDVLLQTSFEESDWYTDWGLSSAPRNTSIVQDDAFRGDSALRIHIQEGSHNGASFSYKFGEHGLEEPEEIYFRYAVRLGPDWLLSERHDGNGKLPGFGGRYGRAGWGGRAADGTNGWSARMRFSAQSQDADRSSGHTRLAYYVYHPDKSGSYGDPMLFSGDGFEPGNVLHRNEWYQVEGYVQMNTPGENDGILRAWVNGEPVFEKTDLRFRDISDLKIEEIWFDIYVGGSWTAPQDQYVDFDNVVVARNYIGPASEPEPVSPIFSEEPYFGDVRNFAFGDPTRWTVIDDGEDLRLALQRSGSAGRNILGAYAIGREPEFGDFRLSFEGKSREDFSTTGAADLAAVFGWQDEANYYYFLANADADHTRLSIVEDGEHRVLAQADLVGLPDEGWHDFEIERVGERIEVWRGDMLLLETTDTTFGMGKVGVGSLNDTALFDNISVVGLDGSEPADLEDAGSTDKDVGTGDISVDPSGDTGPSTDDSEGRTRTPTPQSEASSCSTGGGMPADGVLALVLLVLFGRRR